MYLVLLAFQCIYGCSDKGGEKEWRLPVLYAYDLFMFGDSEGNLREMVGWFVELRRRVGLKVKAGKS